MRVREEREREREVIGVDDRYRWMNGGERRARAKESGWYVGASLHSITHSIDVDYRQNTSIRQHLTMTSARVHTRAYIGGWTLGVRDVRAAGLRAGCMKSRGTWLDPIYNIVRKFDAFTQTDINRANECQRKMIRDKS